MQADAVEGAETGSSDGAGQTNVLKYVPARDLDKRNLRARNILKTENFLITERARIEAGYADALDDWVQEYDGLVDERMECRYLVDMLTHVLEHTRTCAEQHRNLAEKMVGDNDVLTEEEVGTFNQLFNQTRVATEFNQHVKNHPQQEMAEMMSSYRESLRNVDNLLRSAEQNLKLESDPHLPAVDTASSAGVDVNPSRALWVETSEDSISSTAQEISESRVERKGLLSKLRHVGTPQPSANASRADAAVQDSELRLEYGSEGRMRYHLPHRHNYSVHGSQVSAAATPSSAGRYTKVEPDRPTQKGDPQPGNREGAAPTPATITMIKWKISRNYTRFQLAKEMNTINTILETLTDWEVERMTTCANAVRSVSKLLVEFGKNSHFSHEVVTAVLNNVDPEVSIREWITSKLQSLGHHINPQTLHHLQLTPTEVTNMRNSRKCLWKLLVNRYRRLQQTECRDNDALLWNTKCKRVYSILASDPATTILSSKRPPRDTAELTATEGPDQENPDETPASDEAQGELDDELVASYVTPETATQWAEECISKLSEVGV